MLETDRIDLTDLDMFVEGRHHAAFARLRRESPVYWNPTGHGGFWALTRYDDVLAAYRDHLGLSSSRGAVLGTSYRSDGDSAGGRMLVASDLPRHRLLRQQMHPGFNAAVADRVEAQVRSLVDTAVATLVRDGGSDFATDIAPELPAGALMAMFGIGRADALALIGMTRRMIGFRDDRLVPGDLDERMRLAWTQSEILEFFTDLVASRRRRPGDDMVSMLLRAEINGRPLPEADVLYNCMNVAVGGNETSSYTACSGLEALIRHPAQYDLLLRSPELLDPALEEMLRWSSTNAYVQRVATRDLEVGGVPIAAGEAVTLWNVSANRDEEQFPDADVFDIRRSPNRHLTFGSGLHRCIGAPTGLVELRVLFARLRAGDVRLALAGPVQRLRSNFILGTLSMPVEVVA